MLQQDDQHQSLSESPSPGPHLWINTVVKFVVDFFESPPLDVLANFLPIILINPLFFDDDVFLDVGVGSFGDFDSIVLEPNFINFNSSLISSTGHS